jgi:hypothetical protein
MLTYLKSLGARLFQAGESSPSGPQEGETVEYKGYRIIPAPYPSRGQHQTAGRIEKEFEDGVREHSFVRAETHPSREDAIAFSVRKAQQIIDEQGDRLFRDRP